jgi:hypothetical protein
MRKMNQFLFKPGRLMIRPGRLMILLALLPGILASAQNLTDKSSVSRTYPEWIFSLPNRASPR